MDDETNCSTTPLISRSVTIGYGALYSLFLVIVSVYSFRFLMNTNVKFGESSAIKKCKIWIKDVYKRRGCYIPIIAHIFDQVTDITVAIQFYYLSQLEYDCNGLNIWYLFILTVLSMAIYRLLSSYLIYQATKSISRAFLQLLDLELFRALYINYLCDKDTPCDPQRYITALEAALESSPQALIQLIYLIKTNSFQSNPIIMVSLMSSLWCIIAKLTSDDKTIVVERARSPIIRLKQKVICNVLLGSIYSVVLLIWSIIWLIFILFYWCFCGICIGIISSCKDKNKHIWTKNKNIWEKINSRREYQFNNVSFLYLGRIIWRIFDVSSHIFLMTMIWIAIGGTALTVKVVFESLLILAICIGTKNWEFIFSIIATVISTATDDQHRISMVMTAYRTVINIILMILVTIWLYVDFECPRCTDYVERERLRSDVFGIFIYLWISLVLCPLFLFLLLMYDVFIEASTSRDLQKKIQMNDADGILEMQLYKTQYGVYDESNGINLLMLAMKEHRAAVIAYLLYQYKSYDAKDKNESNILDYYFYFRSNDAIAISPMMRDNLLKIYNKHPNMEDKDNKLNAQKISERSVVSGDANKAIHDHKILILGVGCTGKATLFNQLRQIHGNGFQQQDIHQTTQNIYDCIIDQMKQLIEQCKENILQQQEDGIDDKEFVYSLSGEVADAADYMLSPKIPRGGIDITPEIAKLIITIWNDESIKQTFKNRTNLGVVDSIPHFFEKIDEIASNHYVPTNDDILLVRIPTTGIRSASFNIDKNKFTIVQTGSQRNERSKWVHQFSMVNSIIYVASLSDFDLYLFEAEDVFTMHEQLNLFDLILKNRYFKHTEIVLCLNKRDLFEKKIKNGKSLKICFPDYDGKDGDVDYGIEYIKQRFLELNINQNRQIMAHVTCNIDAGNVKKVFHDIQHLVVTTRYRNIGLL